MAKTDKNKIKGNKKGFFDVKLRPLLKDEGCKVKNGG